MNAAYFWQKAATCLRLAGFAQRHDDEHRRSDLSVLSRQQQSLPQTRLLGRPVVARRGGQSVFALNPKEYEHSPSYAWQIDAMLLWAATMSPSDLSPSAGVFAS
jgi:hypothetical protein